MQDSMNLFCYYNMILKEAFIFFISLFIAEHYCKTLIQTINAGDISNG